MGLFDGLLKKKEIHISSPVDGICVQISEVSDPTFGEEIIGKGVAIRPSNGRIVSPVDGEISTIFPTGHAVGITTADGVELLIHIGLDTVALKGEHFSAHVSSGDKVKKGDLLVEVDMEAVKEKGYDTITPVIICNTPDFASIDGIIDNEVKAGDDIMILKK